jgi:hypothetical protein
MAEGMAPSAVNDSVRALMARVKEWFLDISGALTTGGTSTAFTITSNEVFASLAEMDSKTISIVPHTTSGASPTLNVDGLGAKALNITTGVAIPTGALVAGAAYSFVYYNSPGEWVVKDRLAIEGDRTIAGHLSLTATDYMSLPSGTTAQRPGSPANGQLRYNSDNASPEFYGGSWVSLQSPLPIPQGYLTPTSNTPIITADAASQTAIYWTPLNGLWATIHNGTSLVPIQLSGQLQLTLTSSQAASNIYDIYLAYNSGTPVIGTSPTWAAGTSGSVTAGSCARGTGTGGTELQRLNGFWTNKASMSLIWNTGSGNTTITVPANQGIYLGSIFIDGSAGQVTCHRSYGQSRKWGIWNNFNRTPTYLKAGDSTSTWSESNATLRALNNNAANSLTVLTGLAEEIQMISASLRGTDFGGTAGFFGVGYNVTNAFKGQAGQWNVNAIVLMNVIQARYDAPPALGIQTITSCIAVTAPSLAVNGTESSNVLTAVYRA